MELLLAIVSGVLYASGVYLMLRRRLAQLIIGLSLLSNGSNILILSAAGVTRGKPPLISEGIAAEPFAGCLVDVLADVGLAVELMGSGVILEGFEVVVFGDGGLGVVVQYIRHGCEGL